MQQIHGGDIYTNEYKIDYSANINPLGTPPAVIAAAVEGVIKAPDYPDVMCRELTAAIALAEGCSQDQIICGNGAAELIFAIARAVQPKKALLIAPGFAEYEQALKSVGCEICYYFCSEEQRFVPGEDLIDQITPDLDMMFICNPNNPTGALLSGERMEQIVHACAQNDVWIAVDECFNPFLQEAESYSVRKLLSGTDHLFILKAFTKIYAMAGLRLGYGLSSNTALLQEMRKGMQPWNVSIPAQMAGVAALGETAYVEKSVAYVGAQREVLKEGLEKNGLTVFASEANYLFFKGPKDLGRRFAEKGILIRDCSNYVGLCEGYFRIAVRREEENLQLLQTLEEILHG